MADQRSFDKGEPDADEASQDRVNPLSANFDPLSALSVETVPGLERVDPLQNIQEFEEYQANPKLFLQQQAQRKEKDALRKAAKQKNLQETKALPTAPSTRRIVKNVLTRMERVEGPTALLHDWVQSRTRVKVVTRSFKSIRGTCSGFVVAFDRYLNLAMVDVDETYCSLYADKVSKKQQTKDSAADSNPIPSDLDTDLLVRRVEALHVTPSSNIQHRHINQVFLRGDNIVSISSCS